jgi:hypothetical protein
MVCPVYRQGSIAGILVNLACVENDESLVFLKEMLGISLGPLRINYQEPRVRHRDIKGIPVVGSKHSGATKTIYLLIRANGGDRCPTSSFLKIS